MSNSGQPAETIEHRFARIAPEIDEVYRNLLKSAHNLEAVQQELCVKGAACHLDPSGELINEKSAGDSDRPCALILPFTSRNGNFSLACAATVFFGVLRMLVESSESRGPVQVSLRALPFSVGGPVAELAADEVIVLDFDESLRPGQVGFLTGTIIPSQQTFELTVSKKDGQYDAASAYNLVPLAAHIVAAVSQIPTRKTDPLKMARVGFTSISSTARAAGGPATALTLQGVIHAPAPSIAETIPRLIEQESRALAGTLDLSLEFLYGPRVPEIRSDSQLQEELRIACTTIFGSANVLALEFLTRDYCGLMLHRERQAVASLHVGVADAAGSHQGSEAIIDTNLRAILTAIRTLTLFYSR